MNQIIDKIDLIDDSLKKVDFYCAFDTDNVMYPIVITPQNKSGYTLFTITASTQPLKFGKIARIHLGDSSKDFNYCDKNYKLKSFISNKTDELRMRVGKTSGTGSVKDLDITVTSEYGDNIVRINIDDDSEGPSSRFKIPSTPKKYTNITRKVTDYITFSEINQDFFLTVHSAENPLDVYFKIDSNSLLFGPQYIELTTKVSTD